MLADVYADLRLIARTKSRTLGASPTSLANETVARLIANPPSTDDHQSMIIRGCRIMHNLNIDGIRSDVARRSRERSPRPRNGHSEPLDGKHRRLAEALTRLDELDPIAAEAIMLAAICRVPQKRIGDALGISLRTVQRKLTFARAWLAGQLKNSGQSWSTSINPESTDPH